MGKLPACAVFLPAAVSLALTALPLAAAQLPRKASEFVIQMPDGPQQLLSAYRGKVVVFAFMYTTCPHCQKTAQVLAKVQTEYAGKPMQVLGVTFDNGAAFRVQQFNKMFGVNFPCGVSTEASVRPFVGLSPDEPYFVPMLVFIDKAGMIRSQYIGDEKFLANQEVNIRAEIDKLLKSGAGSTVATSKKSE
jgi:thiol-disulfide isomerase/thioredoxin